MQIVNKDKKVPGERLVLSDANPGWYVTLDGTCFYEVLDSDDGELFFRSYVKDYSFVPSKLKDMEGRSAWIYPVNRIDSENFEYTEDKVEEKIQTIPKLKVLGKAPEYSEARHLCDVNPGWYCAYSSINESSPDLFEVIRADSFNYFRFFGRIEELDKKSFVSMKSYHDRLVVPVKRVSLTEFKCI